MSAPEDALPAYEVGLTDTARADLAQLTQFLRTNWPSAVIIELLAEFTKRLELLASMPFLGKPAIHYPTLRELAVSRRTMLYYEVIGRQVNVVHIHDTREGSSPDRP